MHLTYIYTPFIICVIYHGGLVSISAPVNYAQIVSWWLISCRVPSHYETKRWLIGTNVSEIKMQYFPSRKCIENVAYAKSATLFVCQCAAITGLFFTKCWNCQVFGWIDISLMRFTRVSVAILWKLYLLPELLAWDFITLNIKSQYRILCRNKAPELCMCIRYPNFATHDDVIKWKHFLRYRPFVWGIHRSPVNSPHKGQWLRGWWF